MATSKERRELAARLRGLAYGHVAVECGSVAHVLGLAYEVHGTIAAFSGDAVARLADLMDPTCRVVIPNEMDGECFCSECGALLGEYGYTAYCPSCGARCVDNGGGHAGDD